MATLWSRNLTSGLTFSKGFVFSVKESTSTQKWLEKWVKTTRAVFFCNLGDSAIDIVVQESEDNGSTDAWSDIVASFTLEPKAKAVKLATNTDEYIQFKSNLDTATDDPTSVRIETVGWRRFIELDQTIPLV